MTITRLFAALSAAALAFVRPRPLPAQAVVPDSAIRAILKDRVDAGRAVGIVVGVIDPDGRHRVVAYGASGTARPLDASTVFEIGSITKTFTAAMLAEMAARGEVALDDPVAKYLPATVKVPSRGGRQITLLDLATQSSGLPRLPTNLHPANAADPYADYSVDRLYDFLSSYALPRDPGAQYEYSNLGFGLLGHALARRAGTDYETALERRLIDPSGMRDTRLALTPSMRERLALGHDASGAVTANWDMATLAGAGGLRSTATDMLAWVTENMAADVDSTRGRLAAPLHDTHTPRRPAGGSNRIGLGWHVSPTPYGGSLVWHNGGTGGYRSFAGYDAGRRIGVVLLSNSTADVDDIARHLMAPELPLDPQPARRTAITLGAAVLDRYVGEYAFTPAITMTVRRAGDGLTAQMTSQAPLPIFAEREGEFFLRAVDAQISFKTDASGAVTGLVLHQNGRDQPARRTR